MPKYSRPDGLCQLCTNHGKLQRSHIIPDAFFRELKQDGRFYGIRVADEESEIPLQIGDFDYLLCSSCESMLNDRYEKWSIEFWRTNRPLPTNSTPRMINVKVDLPATFKLFHLSILFRASVSARPFWSQVNLADEVREELRQMLLCEDAKCDARYGVFCTVHEITHLSDPTDHADYIVTPRPVRLRGLSEPFLGFQFGGCEWFYCIGDVPLQIRSGALSLLGTLPVLRRPRTLLAQDVGDARRKRQTEGGG